MEVQEFGVYEKEDGERGVVAARDYDPLSPVMDVLEYDSKVYKTPDQKSIQVAESIHVFHEVGQFLNHSCKPNLVFIGEYQAFFSLRKIEEGEELTFDYTQTEDRISTPFVCNCKNTFCRGKIGYN